MSNKLKSKLTGLGEGIGGGVFGFIGGLVKPLFQPGPEIPCDKYYTMVVDHTDPSKSMCKVDRTPPVGWEAKTGGVHPVFKKPSSPVSYEQVGRELCPAGTTPRDGLCGLPCPPGFELVSGNARSNDVITRMLRCRTMPPADSKFMIGSQGSIQPPTKPIPDNLIDTGDFIYYPGIVNENDTLSPYFDSFQVLTSDQIPDWLKAINPTTAWTKLTKKAVEAMSIPPLPHRPPAGFTNKDFKGRWSKPCPPGTKLSDGICELEAGCPAPLEAVTGSPDLCRLNKENYVAKHRLSLLLQLLLIVAAVAGSILAIRIVTRRRR